MEVASRCDAAATLLPSGLPSTQAMLRLLLVKPSIYRETAIRESPRPALHRRYFMQRRAREKYDLVLLWPDRLITAGLTGLSPSSARVVETQLSAIELARFAMEKIDEGQAPGSDSFLRIITVSVEEVSIIAGGDLHLGSRYRKLFHPKLFQHPRQTPTEFDPG